MYFLILLDSSIGVERELDERRAPVLAQPPLRHQRRGRLGAPR